jgi:predicted membrane-bound spermidine synthase
MPQSLAGEGEMQIDFHDLLVAVSVLVGFQVTLFMWRIDREAGKKSDQRSWLPPSDWLGGLSMLCFVVGGLLLPILGLVDIQTAKKLFGLGALLTIGHIFGLVGHYQLFSIKVRVQTWFPPQERIVLSIFAALTILYCWLAWF